jgi:hypothetical protein
MNLQHVNVIEGGVLRVFQPRAESDSYSGKHRRRNVMIAEATAEMAPIQYRGFWDVPRIFPARYRGRLYLFDCAFDDVLEDHLDDFTVYELPIDADAELSKDWTTLAGQAIRTLGTVPVNAVAFDPSLRQAVDISILDRLVAPRQLAPVVAG